MDNKRPEDKPTTSTTKMDEEQKSPKLSRLGSAKVKLSAIRSSIKRDVEGLRSSMRRTVNKQGSGIEEKPKKKKRSKKPKESNTLEKVTQDPKSSPISIVKRLNIGKYKSTVQPSSISDDKSTAKCETNTEHSNKLDSTEEVISTKSELSEIEATTSIVVAQNLSLDQINERIEIESEVVIKEKLKQETKEKVSEKIENIPKEKVYEKIEDTPKEKVSEKIEDTPKEKVSEKIEDTPKEKVSEKVEDKSKEEVSEKVEDKPKEEVVTGETGMPAFGDLITDDIVNSSKSSLLSTANMSSLVEANVERREHLYKILVIGELGTGKTSIIKRYVHQFFSQHYRATIGVDFALKILNWDSNTIIRLQLWDIAGQERFGNMTRVYYKEAVGAFIVFDVTRVATFDAVVKWKQDLDSKVQLADGSPIPCVLLANKCDQQKEGLVNTPAKMDEYCKEKGFAGWFETSAKENINIEDAARSLVNKILVNDKLIHGNDAKKEKDGFPLTENKGQNGSKSPDEGKSCSC